MDTITVRSIPIDDGTHWIDCSVCGVVGVCPPDRAHLVALTHLHDHGLDEQL